MPENKILTSVSPNLFGIKYSNRNFSDESSWGKNQFNSSFPASLSAFLEYKGYENIYIKLNDKLKTYHSSVSTTNLYGINPISEDIFYSFESPFLPFQQLLIGSLPRTDLVVMNRHNKNCLTGLEIKLTALPDNSTCNFTEDRFGSELVVRPDTIVYLACSIVNSFQNNVEDLSKLIGEDFKAIEDWNKGENILSIINRISIALDRIFLFILDKQEPLVIQPVWKTNGKKPILSDNCLDVFVWSNLAFAQLFLNVARGELIQLRSITRPVRSIVWLFKLIYDFSLDGQMNHGNVINQLVYDTKTDKAFSVNGCVTYPYMKSSSLTKPRITKNQIKEIILGGGQNLLSPERRFDAIIFNSPELFK